MVWNLVRLMANVELNVALTGDFCKIIHLGY
jgi:hypothetical protein